jgi:dsDNA-specific endonuclease/ATPase MutS2
MLWLLLAILILWGTAWLGRRLLRGGSPPGTEGDDVSGPDAAYEIEIGDELDLHGVPPAEIDAIVDAFIGHAVGRGWSTVKIVHGKGTGRLRERVRALLARHPEVERYADAVSPGSGWGATVVHLRPSSEVAPDTNED